MITLLIALILLGVGAIPAVALGGLRLEAVPLAALVTALVCSVAGLASLAFTGPILFWFIATALAFNLFGLAVFRRIERPAGDGGSALAKVVVMVAATLPLFALRRPVIDWDARSIWSFHGRWFSAGGEYLRDALSNPAFGFSHPDYPPAVPATMGVFWRITGGIDPIAGQVVTALLNVSAVALIGLALVALGSGLNWAPRAIPGVLAVLGSFGVAAVYGANGYVDLLSGGALAAAVLWLLVAPMSSGSLLIGLVPLVVAGLTKNEGLVVALIILALAGLRYRPNGAKLLAFAGSGALLLAWPLLARAFGARSDMTEGVGEVLSGKVDVVPRIATIAESVGSYAWILFAVALACSMVGTPLLGKLRRSMSLASETWNWAAVAGTGAIVGTAYLVTPHELRWHLMTSVERTTIGLRILLLSQALVWVVIALNALVGGAEKREAPSAPVAIGS